MELHEGQKEVVSLLWRGNVCVRVGRRWGKSTLAAFLAKAESNAGGEVLFLSHNLQAQSLNKRMLEGVDGIEFMVINENFDLSKLAGCDLVILDEPAFLPSSFWKDFKRICKYSKRVLAIGTQSYGLSGLGFAELPFVKGFQFYSGPTEENPHVNLDIPKSQGMRFKQEYGGH